MVGLVAGAALAGVAVGWFGASTVVHIDEWIRLAFVATAAAIYGLVDLGVIRFPRVSRRWQVPRVWLRQVPLPATYLLFGVLLGAGFLTYAPYAALTTVLLMELALGSPELGLAIGAFYGTGKVVALLWGKWDSQRASSDFALVQRIAGRTSAWQRALGAAGLAVAILHGIRVLG